MTKEEFERLLNNGIAQHKSLVDEHIKYLNAIKDIVEPVFKKLNTKVELDGIVLHIYARNQMDIEVGSFFGWYKYKETEYSLDDMIKKIIEITSKSYIENGQ